MTSLAPADVVILVDVLSFTTCLDIALSRGAVIVPLPLDAPTPPGALAAGRRGSGPSLSPASLAALPPSTRLVLPSPNGSRLSLLSRAPWTLAACLRNATAVGHAARSRGQTVNVVPAGERWQDGSLRPALEDWLGAGAVVAALAETSLSPEARAARDAYLGWRTSPALDGCGSARELISRGFAEDVAMAVQVDVSGTVPVLREGAWRSL
jgi:2-phosphosulfolactate phosphatase